MLSLRRKLYQKPATLGTGSTRESSGDSPGYCGDSPGSSGDSPGSTGDSPGSNGDSPAIFPESSGDSPAIFPKVAGSSRGGHRVPHEVGTGYLARWAQDTSRADPGLGGVP